MNEIAKAYKALFDNGQITLEDIPEEIREELFPKPEDEKKDDTKGADAKAETTPIVKHTNPWD